VVENNKARKGKKLWTEADAGDLIGLYGGYDSENEALFIADATEKFLASNPKDHVAVLYRTNSQSRQIEEALRRYGRKYNVVGGFSFYQRAEIKDTVAYLKLAAANSDSVSLMRVINTPARGIGRTTVTRSSVRPGTRAEPVGCDQSGLSTTSSFDAIAIVAGDLPQPDQELSLVASQSTLPMLRHILTAPVTRRCSSWKRRRNRKRGWRIWMS
jgi:DNA helicase-2/ATP-dependent DNA helicase PcrA